MALISKLPSGGDSSLKLNIFTQEAEPTVFNGIWVKTNRKYRNVVTDNDYWLKNDWNSTLEGKFWTILQNAGAVPSADTTVSSYVGGVQMVEIKGEPYVCTCYKDGVSQPYGTFLYRFDPIGYSAEFVAKISNCNFKHSQKNNTILNVEDRYLITTYSIENSATSKNIVYIYDIENMSYSNISQACDGIRPDTYRGRVYFWENSSLYALDPSTKIVTKCNSPSSFATYDYYVEVICNDNGIFFVNDFNGGQLYKYNDETNTYEQTPIKLSDITTTYGRYAGMYGQGNKIYIANTSDYNIYYIDTQTWEHGVFLTREDYTNSQCEEMRQIGNYFYVVSSLYGTTKRVEIYSMTCKEYDENTIILNKTNDVNGVYYTELISIPNGKVTDFNYGTHRLATGFNDVLYYHDGELDNTLPTFYGDGRQWVKFKN